MENIIFNSSSGAPLNISGVIGGVEEFVRKAPARRYKIIIGSDSQASSPSAVVTAITVWRIGNGAIHFWTKSPFKSYHTLRDRIWDEAISSITLGQEIRGRITAALGDEFFWDGNEIHVDAGKNGPTREVVDGISGMILGYGFTPVVKPFAFGASTVADRHT